MAEFVRPRLLCIDDDAMMAELIGAVAEKAGYEPILTTDFDAFRAGYDESIAVVTVDLRMPDTDGVEILRYLAEASSRAAVILISGVDRKILSSVERLTVERSLHLVARFGKPLDSEGLVNVLTELGAHEPRRGDARVAVDAVELRRAIEQKAFRVLFQPKVELSSRRLTGFEAMLRWHHDDLGPLDPAMIIGVAEEAGLVMPLTRLVLESACEQLTAVRAEIPEHRIAINLSGRCLDEIELPELIRRVTSSHGIEPSQIILEVTESCIADDIATALDVTTRLRLMQFELSIDDFGTGVATLQQLRWLPFTEMKIDQSFIFEMLTHDDALRIVESTIELGHSLRMRVVAEGVELESQWKILAKLGCDIGQGFLIGAPMPATELPGWFRGWRKRA